MDKLKQQNKKKDCRFSRLCKSTRRGTWIDCSLGKGLICQPDKEYCKYEQYKPKELKIEPLQEALSVNEINQLRDNYNKLVEQCKELQKELVEERKNSFRLANKLTSIKYERALKRLAQ